jgi:acetyl-CoA carboxylase alpha subunit
LSETHLSQTQADIASTCDAIKALLLEKNRKYGDSALNPVRVFSQSDTLEQMRVRMDDKLSRLRNQQDDEDEDVIADLTGYLILYQVARMQQRRSFANYNQP